MVNDVTKDKAAARPPIPFIFSFITVRFEGFGAIVFNPFLDKELDLDPIGAYIVELMDGSRSCGPIAVAARKRFRLTAEESRSRVLGTLTELTNILAIGFLQDNERPARLASGTSGLSAAPGRLSSPKSVTWEATYACNLHCPHCYNDSGASRPNELDTKGAFRLIDKLAEVKVLRLLITGGEPLLRPDILQILRKASTTNMRLDLATNGFELPQKLLRGLRSTSLFHVHVSIDGIGGTHDRFRGRKGAFEAACSSIEKLMQEDIAVSVSTTVTRNNLKELERIIDFSLDMGCYGFFANALLPSGRGRRNAGVNMLDARGYHRMYRTLVEKGNSLHEKLVISTNMCFPFLLSDRPVETSSKSRMGCSAGNDTLCIGADGTVYPCHFLHDLPLGNITKDDLGALWSGAPVLNSLRNLRKEDMAGECKNCQYAPGLCHGGCRAAAYLQYGYMTAVDPTCFRQAKG